MNRILLTASIILGIFLIGIGFWRGMVEDPIRWGIGWAILGTILVAVPIGIIKEL